MIDSSVSIPFSNNYSNSSPYWIRLEQESQDPDAVTNEEVAEVLDQIFEVEACSGTSGYSGGESLEPIPNEVDILNKSREIVSIASDVWGQPICSSGDIDQDTGDYSAIVKVFRSHVCTDYEILLNNGTFMSQAHILEDITIAVQVDGYETNLDLPISRSCGTLDTEQRIFEGDADITFNSGSIIKFSDYVTIYHLTYTTEYDLLTINVPGKGDGVVGECVMFCIYNGLSVSLTIDPPSIDDETSLTCLKGMPTTPGDTEVVSGDTGTTLDPWDGSSPKCYQTTTIEERCECTGKEHDSYDIENEVNCPDDETAGAHGAGDSLKSVYYVNCGKTDKYGTSEFYEKACCHPGTPPVRCEKHYSVWSGGAGDSSKLDAYRGEPNTSLIPVSPKDGICGIQVIEQEVSGSCCEDADPLEVTHMTADVIRPGGSVIIYIEGDIGPIEWKANGGYEMAYDETATPGKNMVYANPDGMCNDARVMIKGACDSINVIIPLDEEFVIPLEIANQEPITMAPNAFLLASAFGGVLPYKWSSDKLTLVESSGSSALFKAPSDFCAMASVTVHDECGDTDSVKVKSTQGHWEQISPGYRTCEAEGVYTRTDNGMNGELCFSGDGEYRARLYYGGNGFYETCNFRYEEHCPHENQVSTNVVRGYMDSVCNSYIGEWTDATPTEWCCEKIDYASNDPDYEDYGYLLWFEFVLTEYKWECP